MTDLIKRLREADTYNKKYYAVDPLHQEAADRIEELAEERDTARRLLGAATQMQTETQAKLTKTMEALRGILKGDDMYPWRIAREALAELEGK
jgi:hypothetical protein